MSIICSNVITANWRCGEKKIKRNNICANGVSEDVIGNTYIYLIERFASDSGKKAGEFFTPLKVTELVAKLAGPKPGDRICDPACGSGGLLIQAAKEMGDRNFALFGQESNDSTWALCRMNMFLHSFDSARVEWCDTLNSPLLVENDRGKSAGCRHRPAGQSVPDHQHSGGDSGL